MLELLSDPNVWAALATLTVMEIVLGVDNIVFISVLVSRLPKEQADRARKLGLALALVFRIMLLLVISWIIALDTTLFTAFGHGFSWKDLILIAGGLFLVWKATKEIHHNVDPVDQKEDFIASSATTTFASAIGQILLLDLVFSIDSIITAVGMTPHVPIMVVAVVAAVTGRHPQGPRPGASRRRAGRPGR